MRRRTAPGVGPTEVFGHRHAHISGHCYVHMEDTHMDMVNTAREYARQHPQQVQLIWVNRRIALCPASEAVDMCAVPHVAACIVGAVADDKTLENLLNQLIDGE